MRTIRYGLLLVLVMLAVAGCNDGGGDSSEESAPTAIPSPTATIDPSTPTPLPTAPPTWTPKPSLTPVPPQPTIDYEYSRPTATDLILPTYTPSPVPPTNTPPGPVIMITAAMLNQVVSSELEGGSGGFYRQPPTIGFKDGVMNVTLDVLTTPGDVNTARTVTIQATVTAEQGRVVVNKVRAFYVEDNAVYDTELEDNILETIRLELTDLVVQLYGGGADARFSVSEVLVADTGLTIQTVTIPE